MAYERSAGVFSPAVRDASAPSRLPEPADNTKSRLIGAARAILAEGGVSALTVDAITRRAGVNKAAISYHFGGKASLVALVVDMTVQEMTLDMVRAEEQLPAGEERIARHIEGEQRISENDDVYRAWFGAFPLAFGDPRVRQQLDAAYQWYVSIGRKCLGDVEGASDAELESIARLVTAVADGLAAQRCVAEGGLDVSEPFRLFSRMVALLLNDLRRDQNG